MRLDCSEQPLFNAGISMGKNRREAPQRSAGRRTKAAADQRSGARAADEGEATSAGHDAVCFTAGFTGASFAAGTIHAYLASDRSPPRVVAGISMGAVNAAAMQKCYRELEKAGTGQPHRREAARWAWFRKYLFELSNRPLEPIWDSLPSPEDFFADRPPVVDLSTPPSLDSHANDAMRQRYLLVQAGQWLTRSKLTVRNLTRLLVWLVRWKEGYPGWWVWRLLMVLWAVAPVAWKITWHVALHPRWRKRPRLTGYASDKEGWRFGPIVGWGLWLVSLLPFVGLLTGVLWGAARVVDWLEWDINLEIPGYSLIASASAFALWILAVLILYFRWRGPVLRLLRNFGVQRGLIEDYFLMRKLRSLFGEEQLSALDGMHPPQLLAVVSSLQTEMGGSLHSGRGGAVSQQRWLEGKQKVYEALCTALALPPLLKPTRDGKVDLIDGSAVRRNPLPALFSFLKNNKKLAYSMAVDSERNCVRTGKSIHVVYNVPIKGNPESGGKYPEEQANIVDVTLLGIRLAHRRDTQLEVKQTNLIGKLEALLWKHKGIPPDAEHVDAFPLRAGEIAPDFDPRVTRSGSLRTSPTEILEHTAHGCWKTLSYLYAAELKKAVSFKRVIRCKEFLLRMAPERREFLEGPAGQPCPGLAEVCSHCPWREKIEFSPDADSPEAGSTGNCECGSLKGEDLAYLQPHEPRIIFAASGGVFRGAFHIGVAGALLAARIKPDIVAGASVGTLLGGAVATMFRVDPGTALDKLNQLVEAFAHVDRRVALTRTLKRAFRDLGVRGSMIDLSLHEVRKRVLKGVRSDPGYAAAGAPPVLIDAIADFFRIPHEATRQIASRFVAGHFKEAGQSFWEHLRTDGLRRLDIEHALMGASLLKSLARDLLPADTERRQPYQDTDDPRKGIAFFATTTDLGAEELRILGRDELFRGCDYDFVEAALASSAFPGVFAPRRQSDVFPGFGNPQVRYADGGIFDNLPILATLQLLRRAQSQYRNSLNERLEKSGRSTVSGLRFLRQRHEAPHLILVGALNANPETSGSDEFDDVIAVWRRAGTLSYNVKIKTLEMTSERLHKQVGKLLEFGDGAFDANEGKLLDRIVHAAVLPVYPADSEHLNGTFAFCRSMGMTEERVLTSIADGCYQTLAAFAADDVTNCSKPSRKDASSFAAEVIARFKGSKRIPDLLFVRRPKRSWKQDPVCPFYKIRGATEPFKCPFALADSAEKPDDPAVAPQVYLRCIMDRAHGRSQH